MTTDELLLRILGETTTINTQLSAMLGETTTINTQLAAMAERLRQLEANTVALVAMMMLSFGVWWWFND